ncbi:MAG: acyl-CoA dehydrogenase family protein, partial [Pseudonocardia sp.]|nr:acyl-CoA dehydrogenase family protein [Pseudonocardia sp.]
MAEKVIEAVRELLPAFRDRAQKAEDARRLSEETIKSLQEAGLFRMLQPARFGGYEADPVAFYTAIRMIASACGS